MAKRTFNTLFMLSSVDGKISTGEGSGRDFDKDLPKINGIKEGLKQYYQLEAKTDLFSFNTGKVMEKIGMNKENLKIEKIPVSFVIVDNKHLNKQGIINLLKKCKRLYLVTSNRKHPGLKIKNSNLNITLYKNKINFLNLFQILRWKHGVERLTIQSGGQMNSILIRAGLIDEISIVIAPALIGGKNTPTLMDGESILLQKDLKKIKSLRLIEIKKLNDSYLNIKYEVINKR